MARAVRKPCGSTIPRCVWAIWWSILYGDKQPMATFTIAEETMQAPQVDFGTTP